MKRTYRFLTLIGCLLGLMLSLVSQACLAQTGEVLGFGGNSFGQIGDNTTTDRPLVTPAFNISGIKAVACGWGHTLALDSNGTVWAWGYNSNGQLGDGTTTNRSTPVAVLGGIKAISAGAFHNLALDYAGRVWSWGYNYYGQLGTGDTTDRHAPVLMSGSYTTRVKAISAGGYHSLVLTDQGWLTGCGMNLYGELAQGDYNNRSSLTYICSNAVAMAGGGYHTLVKFGDDRLFATGYNSEGELGDGTTTTQNLLEPIASHVRTFAAGLFHNFVVKEDGTVFGWGYNYFGQLGLGDTTTRFVPTQIPGLNNIKTVAGGDHHSLILTASGTVFAAGYNSNGQLGDGTATQRLTFGPVKNTTFANGVAISAIAAGGMHSVLLKPFAVVYGSGLNNHGQLGLGHFQQKNAFGLMARAGNSIIAIATGNSYGMHSLMLRADGTVWACGMNSSGQLGNGTTTDSALPVQVKGPGGVGVLNNIIAIAAGENFSLALAADGTVYSWGNNAHGQLGVGNFTSYSVPVQVTFMTNVYAIAAGGQHSILLANGGQIFGAGWNAYGQVGSGGTTDHVYFDAIESFFNVISVAAGGAHTLALMPSGQIYAWGSNYAGQLALGDATDRHLPTAQPGTIATAIFCGGNHSMHVNGAGEVYVSGGNPYGELGLGNTLWQYSWTYCPNAQYAMHLATGLDHTFMSTTFGYPLGCGWNANGQLGNKTTTNNSTFTLAVDDSNFLVGGVIGMAAGGYHTLILSAPQIRLISVTVSPTSGKGGTTFTGTVSLNGPAGPGGQRVSLYGWCDSIQNAITVPAFVDIPPSGNKATFPITTYQVTTNTTGHVNAYLNYSLSTAFTMTP